MEIGLTENGSSKTSMLLEKINQWRRGERIEGKYTFADGSYFDGKWKAGAPRKRIPLLVPCIFFFCNIS